MNVAIGTKNPAKIYAVRDTLIRERLTITSVEVDSGVSKQPFSDDETMIGALNRAKAALLVTDASLGIGLEGGVTETNAGLMLCNWGAICHVDGRRWLASGAKILLPDHIIDRLKDGEELGRIIESLSVDSEDRMKQGAVGYCTLGRVNRKEVFAHIVKLLYGQYIASGTGYRH